MPINDSKLAQEYGLNVRELETIRRIGKHGKEKFNVCIPKDELNTIRNLWKNYETVLKKNRHRRIVDKLRNLTNLGTKKFNESDGKRVDALIKAFRDTDNYITQASEFFKNCRRGKEIKKYAEQIEKDYNTLDGKGYLEREGNSYDRGANRTINNKFDKSRFLVVGANGLDQPAEVGKGNPHENDYNAHVKEAYTRLYDAIDNFCKGAQGLVTYLETMKNSIEGWDNDLEDSVAKIRNNYAKIKQCSDAIDFMQPYVDKCNHKGIQSEFQTLRDRFDMTLGFFESINKKSTRRYMNAVFYNSPNLNDMKLITLYLGNCTKRLDKFCSGLQSGALTTEELKKTYKDATTNFSNLNTVATKQNLFTGQPVLQANPLKKMEHTYDKLNKACLKLQQGIIEYNKAQDKFMSKYMAWKKDKEASRRRIIMFAVFGAFAVLSAGALKLNPLLEAFILQYDAPVEPFNPAAT